MDHPIWHELAYCVALGGSGMEFGLSVYLGDEGLRHYLRVTQFEDDFCSPDLLDTIKASSAQLADRNQ